MGVVSSGSQESIFCEDDLSYLSPDAIIPDETNRRAIIPKLLNRNTENIARLIPNKTKP
jgi:hypothetical protein